MAIYYKTKCPHCKKIIETIKHRKEQYGYPFMTCKHCSKPIINTNYIEPALFTYDEIKKREFNWSGIIFLGIGILFCFLEVLFFGLLFLGIGIFTIIYSMVWNPKKDENFKNKYIESKQRLSNPHYVIALWEKGCFVTTEIVEWAKKAISDNPSVSENKKAEDGCNQINNNTVYQQVEILNLGQEKMTFSVESFANNLAKLASQELLDVMNLCSNKQTEFDERKLVISTFAYFYGIWVFNYKNVTTEQEKTIQEIYKKQFSDFNRTAFENDTFKQVVDNEYEFDKLLYYIIKRINESHEKFDDKQSFEYDKLSNEFISEFIVNEKYKEKIELDIKTKIMRDWALVASKTGQVSEIQKDK